MAKSDLQKRDPNIDPLERSSEHGIALCTERPGWMPTDQGRGSEDVGQDDITLPRVEVFQALSPQLKKNDPKFIEGAEQGIIFNTLSGELYGDFIVFIPIVFRKEYIIWQSRAAGGGFIGTFPTEELAEEHRQTLDNPDDHEVNLHAVNFVYVVKENGELEEAVFSWSRSKLKVSRKLNALVQMNPGDRFSKAYKLKVVEEKGKKGDYFSYDVKPLGYVSPDVYSRSENLYKLIRAGERKVAYGENVDEVEPESAVM